MSSESVRTAFMAFLVANSAETNILDMTDEFDDLNKFLADEGVGDYEDWIGVEFIGDSEEATGLAAGNTEGCFREIGAFFLHVVTEVRQDIKPRVNILPRIEALRSLLREQRIGDIVIRGVTPPNFASGATLQFEGGFQSASFTASYYNDIKL